MTNEHDQPFLPSDEWSNEAASKPRPPSTAQETPRTGMIK
eukprot:CAMPEP_0198696544 /NCGR_PEP_ID=MMETSP1468-20131203/308574_1 /TAXON_ID=1461545 /ORGANISM="Mantoniella sp, Strain CCMP1436" /LENGTH=39 /DNA_ID= /DNA_START= /DNA_END= /DNA_ORIENTATION=